MTTAVRDRTEAPASSESMMELKFGTKSRGEIEHEVARSVCLALCPEAVRAECLMAHLIKFALDTDVEVNPLVWRRDCYGMSSKSRKKFFGRHLSLYLRLVGLLGELQRRGCIESRVVEARFMDSADPEETHQLVQPGPGYANWDTHVRETEHVKEQAA